MGFQVFSSMISSVSGIRVVLSSTHPRYILTYIYVYLYVCTYIFTHLCIYIYIYIYTGVAARKPSGRSTKILTKNGLKTFYMEVYLIKTTGVVQSNRMEHKQIFWALKGGMGGKKKKGGGEEWRSFGDHPDKNVCFVNHCCNFFFKNATNIF